jgi:hypothetical protein
MVKKQHGGDGKVEEVCSPHGAEKQSEREKGKSQCFIFFKDTPPVT